MPYGSDLTSEPEKLALDVGNRLCPGVIDHHQPGADDECTTSLILKYPQYVQDHLKDVPMEEVTIITHVSPDLDAVTSAFFVHALLSSNHFPPFAEVIASYVRDVDMGICFRHPNTVVTVYSVFTALCELIRKEAGVKEWSGEDVYRMRMECGFHLWEYVITVMDEQTELHDSKVFEGDHPFQEAVDMVKEDYASYLQDLKKSTRTRFSLPFKSGEDTGDVDSLFIVDPQSLLFRSWARAVTQQTTRPLSLLKVAQLLSQQLWLILFMLSQPQGRQLLEAQLATHCTYERRTRRNYDDILAALA